MKKIPHGSKSKKSRARKPKTNDRLKEQGPNFMGTPTFSGTGNYGVGGYKQLAHFGLNPATQKMVDQEQEELEDNIAQQAWSLPGKRSLGSPGSPENNDKNLPRVRAGFEEQAAPLETATTRMKDLPGFPRVNSLVAPKNHVPANDHPRNVDTLSGQKANYIGPTLMGKPLGDISPSKQEDLIGTRLREDQGLQELLGAPRATRPDRQGWNNTKINSLAFRRNHINPDQPPPEMWRPLFKQPEGPHNPRLSRDPMEDQNSPANNNVRPSKTPAWSMGSIGYPKQHVPEDYEQANSDYEDVIKDPMGSRRLQLPKDRPFNEEAETSPASVDPKKAHWASVKPPQGSLGDSSLGGSRAFQKSRQRVLRNLIEILVQEVLKEEGLQLEQSATVPPPKRRPAQGAPAERKAASFEEIRALLRNKSPESLTGAEVSSVIDFVSSKTDLKQEFRAMDEKEIQNMETVLDNNVDNLKIGPLASKIELARGHKHLAQQGQPSSPPPVPSQAKRPSAGPGGGPAQKISLPKQALSKDFTDAVKQKYDQIVNAQGLSKQQKEKILQQLGAVQFQPEGSESSKLRRIEDLVRTTIGTRVDIPTSTPQKTIPATQMPTTQPSSGFLGKAKGFLGLNELGLSELTLREALLEQED